MTDVYILWHQHDPDDEGKLLGVYSARAGAEARIHQAIELPGFRRYPDDFIIDRYDVDADQWLSGFVEAGVDYEWPTGVQADVDPP